MQASLALGVEAGHPAVSALAGDAHGLGHMSDRHPELADPVHQQAPAMERQAGVTVTHEDLRLVKTAISTAPGVFAAVNDPSPTSWPSTPRRGPWRRPSSTGTASGRPSGRTACRSARRSPSW